MYMAATNMAVYMANRRKRRRDELIQMSGGKCVRCGSVDDLHFDHINPKQRSLRLNGKELDGSWENIVQEWRKCQLLCKVCHLAKTRENRENNKEPWNKGKSKDGMLLPEHGCERSYMRGCRCDECRKARHDARVARGETSGIRGSRGANQGDGIAHGTRRGYQKEKRLGLAACEECRMANAEATRLRKQRKKFIPV